MCGICGIVRPAGDRIEQSELLRMRDALIHRGPDGAGIHIHENVGLGHRRLKIIDLSDNAAQPMTNEDGTIHVTFNGEIYNFKEIRARLEAKGHRFRSHSDTEVIVHGYEEWGEQCVEQFNGMFAFAVADQRRREVFLARDRLGIKPLYFYATPRVFLFASEIKALLECRDFQREVNTASLLEQVVFRSGAETATLFRGVHQLPAGYWLHLNADLTYHTRRYWDIDFSQPALTGSQAEVEESVLQLLTESVALQEMSDVPIGTQLSGGTDSSLVSALLARQTGQPIKTFSIGFDEEGFNELPYARLVSKHLQTEHHEIILNNQQFADLLPKTTWHRDEPLVHANGVGVYALCQQAKPEATVLLTGEGADEAFGGYYRYDWLRKCVVAKQKLPRLVTLLTTRLTSRRMSSVNKALSTPLEQLIVGTTAIGYDTLRHAFDPLELQRLVERRVSIFRRAGAADWLAQALYYDLRTFLPALLLRQDKMSMAHSVETRVPFLDHRLIELAYRVPTAMKLRDGQGKHLLKQIAGRYLPREIIFRPKIGFGFPLDPWMRTDTGLGALLLQLPENSSYCSRLLPRQVLTKLIEEHRSGRANHCEPLWTLISLETWHRRFFGTPPEAVTPAVPVISPAADKTTVAHVVLSLKVGGLERVVVNLVKGMQNSRYRSIVCCLEEAGEFAAEIEKLGVPLIVTKRRQGIDWAGVQQLAYYFRAHGVQIVHTHNPAPHFHGLFAAKLANVPVCVHTRHGRNFPGDRRKVFLNRMLSWGTDMIVPVSQDAAAVALNVEHINPAKLQLIWNGVDADRFRPLAPYAPRPPIIGTVARLSWEKDYPTMLRAFRLVVNEIPAARLVFVGDGPEAAALHELTAQLKLQPNVDFLGLRTDICELLNTFSLFTLSSTTEGLSMTMIEALATGLPLVATDVGGNREIVNAPECGLIVPARDPAALAATYLELLRDPDRRAEMGRAGRQRVIDHFSLQAMVRHYINLYENLLSAKAPNKRL
ncbi:MAG: asparagine synthase (glutamine-hydrolyzing) [Verrucomicrobiota bacterium]